MGLGVGERLTYYKLYQQLCLFERYFAVVQSNIVLDYMGSRLNCFRIDNLINYDELSKDNIPQLVVDKKFLNKR